MEPTNTTGNKSDASRALDTPSSVNAADAAVRNHGAWTRIPFTPPAADVVIEGVACVRAKDARRDKNGGTYFVVEVGHRDGTARLKVWAPDAPAWKGIAQGDAVYLALRGKPARGTWPSEWAIQAIRVLPVDHPIRDDLLPACPIAEDELQARWDAVVAVLSPAALALLEVVMDTVGEAVFRRAPAAERVHHAVAPHGLWWHCIEVCEAALALAHAIPTYAPTLSVDVLVLGALLHDLGKVIEYAVVPGVGIVRAPVANARYHTTLGIQLVTEAVVRHRARLDAAEVPEWMIDAVLHVIESHHSKPEWGSPSEPASREAWLIHLADMVSAKLSAMTASLAGATALDDACWYRPADGRRAMLMYPVPATEMLPKLPPPPSSSKPDRTVDSDVAPVGSSEEHCNLTEPTGVASATDRETGDAADISWVEREPATPACAPQFGIAPCRSDSAHIGLPMVEPGIADQLRISLHEEDLRLLLIAAGLAVKQHPHIHGSADRLTAVARTLIVALNASAQAAVRTSVRALRAVSVAG